MQATIASAAGLLLSDRAAIARAKVGRVVVVGAGFAGLACAHELRHAGWEITVLEASGRLGGRAFSLRDFVKGKVVEGGGEFIGQNHPAWLRYAERFGLEMRLASDYDELEAPVEIGDRRLSAEESLRLYEELSPALDTLNEPARLIDADAPWNATDARNLDARSLADWIARLEVSPLARAALTVLFSSDNAVPTDRASYLGMLTVVKGHGVEKYWTETEAYRCAAGNQQLALKLADAIGRERVLCNRPVSKITTSESVARIETTSGEVFEADDVVLAIAPSVWSKIEFNSPLPRELAPQMGRATKHLSVFRASFWPADKVAPTALTDGSIGLTWESTDGQRDPSAGDAVVLAAFSGSERAAELCQLSREMRDRLVLGRLERLYPGAGRYHVQSQFMGWPDDPWTRGSYSFPAPGQITRLGSKLVDGLGRLHFAGEHTCYKFAGYMEGALQSGIRAARQIARV
jgi:monoamine oxidase